MSLTERLRSSFSVTLPCGLWQSVHVDLAFAHRHMRRVLEHLRALSLVALEAGVRLRTRLQLILARHALHDRMAVDAGKPRVFVDAAGPIGAIAALMAGETDAVLFFRATRIVRLERHDAADAASAAGLHVRRAGTMAVLAGELALARVMLMRPIRVFLNSAICAAWQPAQTLAPTKWASTGATYLPFPFAALPFGGLAAGAASCSWLAQPIHQIVRFGHFGLALERCRLGGAHALRERLERGKSPVVELGSLRRLGAGCLRRIDLLRVGRQRRKRRSSAICPRGWLDSSALAVCDQAGRAELMPATVKPPSALAD